MSENNNFIINLIAALQGAKSKAQLNGDIRRIQKQLDKLELKAEISPDSITEIQKKLNSIKIKAEIAPDAIQKITNQLQDIANRYNITISNINMDSRQAEKSGQQMGEGINRGLSSTLKYVRQSIANIIGEFNKNNLKSADLSKEFNLNRSNIDPSVTRQVQALTKELNALAKEALKTNSDAAWDGIVNKINTLTNALNKFGMHRDTSSFKESLDILDYFNGKKIFIDDKSELIQNTGMSIRQLNNQFRNLGVTFTNTAKNATHLDTIWTELFNISPGMEKFTTFGDMISAVVEHLKIAKNAMFGEENLQPLKAGEVQEALLGWVGKLDTASRKLNVLREQETEIQQQISQQSLAAANNVVKGEEKKQHAYEQTAQKIQNIRNQGNISIPQIKDNISNGFYAQQIEQQIEKYNRLGLELPNVKARIEELKTAEQELNSVMGNENSTLEQQTQAYQKFQTALKNAKASNATAAGTYMSKDAVDNLIARLQIFAQKHTGMTESAKAEIDGWITKLQQTGNVYKSTGNDAVSAMKKIEASQNGVGKTAGSLFASLKKSIPMLSYWTSATYLFMQAVAKIKQAFTELKEVNSIMTEISKVSKATAQELANLEKSAFGTASKYGKKISDYLTGIQDFSRAGFRGKNAEDMAELSVLAQAAGDMTADLSNQYLIATDAAYKLNGEAKKLNGILDGQNYIANNNATNMTQLANATKVVASQAASSGIAVNEMSAAIGTMIAVTQDSGEVAGRAFKAILMNLQQVSGELDDGEIIDETSLTKYEKACNELGVSLKEVKNGIVSLRDPMQILKELSAAYTSLDKMDARRANLISAIGGKYRGNQLNALLENWKTYEKMLTDYSNGSGSAMNEAMKSANNWEGSLNRLHNTWVNTVENIANSDAIITVINGTNSLLDVLNKLTSKLGSVGTIGIGAFALLNKGRSNDFAL